MYVNVFLNTEVQKHDVNANVDIVLKLTRYAIYYIAVHIAENFFSIFVPLQLFEYLRKSLYKDTQQTLYDIWTVTCTLNNITSYNSPKIIHPI